MMLNITGQTPLPPFQQMLLFMHQGGRSSLQQVKMVCRGLQQKRVKMEMSWTDMKALEALLCHSEEQQNRYSTSQPSTSKQTSLLTPGFIGPPSKERSVEGKGENEKWEQAEQCEDLEAESHGRERPAFEYVYKQAVSPNDVYLQMSGKNPSTLCCEDLVMKVKLPRVQSAAEVKLDVHPTYVQLASMDYYLGTTLPHTVKVDKSYAKWDSASCTLVITLPIVREYDGNE